LIGIIFVVICIFVIQNHLAMTTFTIKINERTKAGKAFRAMTETFFKDAKGIEIIENKEEKEDEIYNPEFVKMILERAESISDPEKRKNWKEIDPNNLWESLGLK
jgi:hypothetical protein